MGEAYFEVFRNKNRLKRSVGAILVAVMLLSGSGCILFERADPLTVSMRYARSEGKYRPAYRDYLIEQPFQGSTMIFYVWKLI